MPRGVHGRPPRPRYPFSVSPVVRVRASLRGVLKWLRVRVRALPCVPSRRCNERQMILFNCLLFSMQSAARNKLLEGDAPIVDTGKGELFCTGSGRAVGVSESARRRARALVGEEDPQEASVNKSSKRLYAAQLLLCFGQIVQFLFAGERNCSI